MPGGNSHRLQAENRIMADRAGQYQAGLVIEAFPGRILGDGSAGEGKRTSEFMASEL